MRKDVRNEIEYQRARLDATIERINKLAIRLDAQPDSLRWCDNCDAPYKERPVFHTDTILFGKETVSAEVLSALPNLYSEYTTTYITHCKACDEHYDKLEKAKAIAESCPEAVIKLGDTVKCKGEGK